MTQAFEHAVIEGIRAFAQAFLKSNGVDTAKIVAEAKSAEPEAEPAPVQPAKEVEKAPTTEPAMTSPANEKEQTEIPRLSAAEIDAMDRPTIVDFILKNSLDQTESFLNPETGLVTLKSKRVATIQEWLKSYFNHAEPAGSRQAPPERPVEQPATPAPAEEEPQLSLPTEDVAPTMSPDCVSDPELERKAKALMTSFDEWSKGAHAEVLKRFLANRGCEGNCVMHDRANIEGCWGRLNKKTA